MMEWTRAKSRLFVGLLMGILILGIFTVEGEASKLSDRRRNETGGRSSSTSGQGRKGKQFLFPVVAWPYHHQQYYQGYYLVPQSYQSHSHPQQHQYQYYQYQQPAYHQFYHHQQYQQQSSPISIRKDGGSDEQSSQLPSPEQDMTPNMAYNQNRDVPPVVSVHSAVSILSRRNEEKVAVAVLGPTPSHDNHNPSDGLSSVVVPCKTSNGRAGTCQRFSGCFPMIEMEYGGSQEVVEGDYTHVKDNYMSSPLVEQLLENTNTSICSRGGSGASWDHGNNENEGSSRVVCCPRPERASIYRVERLQKNGIGGYSRDLEVALPSITQRPPVRTVVSRQLIDKMMCGHGKSQGSGKNHQKKGGGAKGKITGGVEATGPKEFPWMVAVFGKNRKIFCGASLITDQFLLSAAHCFSTFAPADIQNLYVHLGDFNLRTNFDGPHEVRKIEKIIINKGFKIQTYKDDIALLKLDRPVNFTERIQPICLPEPTNDLFEKEQLVVTGWGRKFRYGVTSDVLRKVEMPVWNYAECKRVFETFAPGRLLESNICAGDGKKNKDACLGDSGGPAVFHDGRKWVQLGITSWGKGCGNFPGVYTRVDKYLMWITKNLQQYQ